VERIYSKTGVSSRAAVTRFAIQHGLVSSIATAD
jgi:DNA-binding NarL/FixJ family response regulator